MKVTSCFKLEGDSCLLSPASPGGVDHSAACRLDMMDVHSPACRAGGTTVKDHLVVVIFIYSLRSAEQPEDAGGRRRTPYSQKIPARFSRPPLRHWDGGDEAC